MKTPATFGKLRMVHGSVQNVRAIASREVSNIIVELPDEHHVQATVLIHGQYVLVARSSLKVPYGIHDIDLEAAAAGAPSSTPETDAGPGVALDEPPIFVHARVALVRQLPSRMITAITLEVPDAQHVEMTNLLHGRDAIVFPVNLGPLAPLGLLSREQVDTTGPGPAAGATRPGAQRPASSDASGCNQAPTTPSRAGGLRRSEDEIKPTQWLGARCQEETFQEFLRVRTEAAARDEVCRLCGVESRAYIRHSSTAMQAFRDRVYEPYRRYMQQRRVTPAASAPLTASGRRDSFQALREASERHQEPEPERTRGDYPTG